MGDSQEGVLEYLHHLLGSATTLADDGRLLERFAAHRDEHAFAELVARHGPLVYSLCRRVLGNAQDAEDVFQAAFLVLARKAATIRKPEALSCWLHGVAYHLALKARAEAERRRILELQAAPSADSADSELSWREVRCLLDEELQRLPEKERLPLMLCYLEGLTQDEASRRLGLPRGTLKRRLEAGRERLRLRLTRRGVTLGSSLFAVALTESFVKGVVPTALRSATVRAARHFLTHETAAVVATPAALLAKGALQTMLTTKLKLGTMLVLVLCCAATAVSLAIPQVPPEKQPKNKAETSAPARPTVIGQSRKDRYGDPLPEGAKARLGTLRLRHRSMTASAVFTRDGKTVIVGDGNGFVVYWDVATGREVRRLKRTPGVISALAITGDGKTLASASRDQIYFWEVASGKLLSQARLDNDPIIRQMLFTPDGKTLALLGQGQTIHLWDTVGNKKQHDLTGHKGNVVCMTISPDGKTLASGAGDDPHIFLWDISAAKEKLHFAAHNKDDSVLTLAFSPDGKTLASTGNQASFAFFDSKTGKKLRKVENYVGGLSALSYAADGKSLVGIDGDTVHILDAVSGKLLRKFDAPPRNMADLIVSPDSKTLAVLSPDSKTLAVLSPDSKTRMPLWGGAYTFDLWDVASGKLLHLAPGHRKSVNSLAFSADSKILFSSAGIGDFQLLAWDAETGEPRGQIDGLPFGGYHSLALSPDGKLLAAGSYRSLVLLDPASRKVIRTCVGKGLENIASVVWSADSKTLVSSDLKDNTIHVWDAATGKRRRIIEAKQIAGGNIELSPDGATVAAGCRSDGVIHLWDTVSGKELRQIAMPQGVACRVAFSPAGKVLACGGRDISLWDPTSGELLRRWNCKAGQVVFSSDGRTLVSFLMPNPTVHLWETATGKERASFSVQGGGIESLEISRDGRSIATGNTDTTILVWDATGGARPDAALSAEQLQALWRDLRDTDAGRAYRAMWQMALSPKHALPFLAEHLRPAAPLNAEQQKRADRLLADLDSDQFSVRQESEAELVKMGLMVEPALHKTLESKPSLEMRRRIESVLAKLANERLCITRVLEALEHMNTPEARQLLKSQAEGEPRAWLTNEARAIRRRLAEQSVTTRQH